MQAKKEVKIPILITKFKKQPPVFPEAEILCTILIIHLQLLQLPQSDLTSGSRKHNLLH